MNNRFEDTRQEILKLLEGISAEKLYYIKRFIEGLTKKK